MLTDCPHCYKKMHDEADYCPHCRQYVPNAAETTSSDMGVEWLIKLLVIAVGVFFGLCTALDYLSWWRSWEFVPCILVALILGGLITAMLPD